MQLVEVLEGRGHLRHHRPCVGQVHAAHVVALERVHEALGHAIALRTAHRRVDRLQTQLPRNLPGLGGDVCAPVVGDCYDREILAYRAWEGKGLPGEPVREMLIEAVEKRFGGVEGVPRTHVLELLFRDGRRHGLHRVALGVWGAMEQ